MIKNKIRDAYLWIKDRVDKKKNKTLDKRDEVSNGKMFTPSKMKPIGITLVVSGILAVLIMSLVTTKDDINTFDATKKEFNDTEREQDKLDTDTDLVKRQKEQIKKIKDELNRRSQNNQIAATNDLDIDPDICQDLFDKVISGKELTKEEEQTYKQCLDENPGGLSDSQLKAIEMLKKAKELGLSDAEIDLLKKVASGDIKEGSLEEYLANKLLDGERIGNLAEIMALDEKQKDDLLSWLKGEGERPDGLPIPLIGDALKKLDNDEVSKALSEFLNSGNTLSPQSIKDISDNLKDLDKNNLLDLINQGIDSGSIDEDAMKELFDQGLLDNLSEKQRDALLKKLRDSGLLAGLFDSLDGDLKDRAKDLFGSTLFASNKDSNIVDLADNLLDNFSDIQKLRQFLKENCSGEKYEKIIDKLKAGDVLSPNEFKLHKTCEAIREKIRSKALLLKKLERDFSIDAKKIKKDLYSSQKSISKVYGDALSDSDIKLVKCDDILINKDLIKNRYFIRNKKSLSSSGNLLKKKLINKIQKDKGFNERAQKVVYGKTLNDMSTNELKDLLNDDIDGDNNSIRDEFASVDPSSINKDGELRGDLSKLSVYSKDPRKKSILPPGEELQAVMVTETYISDNVKAKRSQALITRDIRHPTTGEIVIPEGSILIGKTGSFSLDTKVATINFNTLRIGGKTHTVNFTGELRGQAWGNRLSKIGEVFASEIVQTLIKSIGVLAPSDENGEDTVANEITGGLVSAGQATTQTVSDFLVKDIGSSSEVFYANKKKMIVIYSN
jgi:hypothetical protein